MQITEKNTQRTAGRAQTKKMRTRIWASGLALAMLLSFSACGDGDGEEETAPAFDYENCNFEEYFTLDPHVYEGMTVKTELPKTVTQDELNDELLEMCRYYGTPYDVIDRAVADGDNLKLYYKGVLVGKDGTETPFNGGTVMTFGSPTNLVIGSGTFIDGFEEGLIGVVPKDTYFFETETTAKIAEDSVAHLTYTGTYEGASKPITGDKKLHDLSKKPFCDAFAAELYGASVGETREFTCEYDANGDKTNETVTFTVTVNDILRLQATTVTVTFPTVYPSSPDLAGKNAKFYVWIEAIQEIEPATLNATFLKDVLKYETEETDVVAAFCREYLDNMQEQRDAVNENDTLNGIWDCLFEKATFKKLPEGEAEAAAKSMKEEAEYYHSYYINQGYSFKSLGDFVIQYYGLKDKDAATFDVDAYFKAEAEKSVKRYLIFWYLLEEYGLTISDEALDEEEEKFYEAEAENAKTQGSNYTAEQIKDQYAQNYGETYVRDYLKNSLLSEKLNDKMLGSVTVAYGTGEDAEAK